MCTIAVGGIYVVWLSRAPIYLFVKYHTFFLLFISRLAVCSCRCDPLSLLAQGYRLRVWLVGYAARCAVWNTFEVFFERSNTL